MNAAYITADVFTTTPFGGNQLAVFPDATAIAPELMPTIAREFNYSETTFVLPPTDPNHTARVRIFTPGGELPFAGHPTVGTAHVLAAIGRVPLTGDETRIVLEEGVGPVPVVIRSKNGQPVFAQLSAARRPEIGSPPPARPSLAAMLSLRPEDLDPERDPQMISCGVPYLFIPLRDRDAVARARLDLGRWETTLGGYDTSSIYVFAPGGERPGSDLRARMFAPGLGVPEDPATGSAAVGLAAYLAARAPGSGTHRWIVEQGFEMGRPSILEIEADRSGNMITATRVGGSSVIVCEGSMRLP
jgi:trans-2,3-dihydro-3-hydroxyanthranilate isomerase